MDAVVLHQRLVVEGGGVAAALGSATGFALGSATGFALGGRGAGETHFGTSPLNFGMTSRASSSIEWRHACGWSA